METINKFKGKYDFLSNFYPCKIIYEDLYYPSVEHAFQAAKTLNFRDRVTAAIAPNGKEAKAFGRKVELRPDWDKIKDKVMYDCVKYKFEYNKKLQQKLLDTGDAELIEGNNHRDKYWGVYKGEGQNKLGKILMQIRKEIRDNENIC